MTLPPSRPRVAPSGLHECRLSQAFPCFGIVSEIRINSLMNRLHGEAGFWISEDLRKLVTG